MVSVFYWSVLRAVRFNRYFSGWYLGNGGTSCDNRQRKLKYCTALGLSDGVCVRGTT